MDGAWLKSDPRNRCMLRLRASDPGWTGDTKNSCKDSMYEALAVIAMQQANGSRP